MNVFCLPPGQQRNTLQGENDDTFKEAQGVLQPETGKIEEKPTLNSH